MRSIAYATASFDENGNLGEPSSPQNAPLGDLLFGTFQLVHGVFPRLSILNDILSRGSFVDVRNLAYLWDPFTLALGDYEILREEVRRNPRWRTEIDGSFEGSDGDWGHWAFVKALTRQRA